MTLTQVSSVILTCQSNDAHAGHTQINYMTLTGQFGDSHTGKSNDANTGQFGGLHTGQSNDANTGQFGGLHTGQSNDANTGQSDMMLIQVNLMTRRGYDPLRITNITYMTAGCTISCDVKHQTVISPSDDWSCSVGFRLALFYLILYSDANRASLKLIFTRSVARR